MLWVQIHYNSGLNLNCNEIIPFSKEWEWERERERERERDRERERVGLSCSVVVVKKIDKLLYIS